MKRVEEMTIDEIMAEIREYECQKDRGYAFISYSHRDRERVYPLILTWMRAGYNIYIDLDFERHGSDSNWTDLMLSTLSSRLCRLAICFKSTNYRYSYASLLELLTLRGETVTNRHSGKRLCVDSVALENIPDDDEIPETCRESYAAAFQAMNCVMRDQFLGQNWKELNLLREGLEFWLEEAKTKNALGSSITSGKMISYIQDAYQAGYQDFFPQIAYLVRNWFISQELNGNDYTLNSSLAIRLARFNEVRVEQVRENLLPAPEPHVPAPARTNAPPRPAGGLEYGVPPYLTHSGLEGTIPLPQGDFSLGRSVTCGYTISGNPAVGRVHAVIRTQNGRSVLIDQHSKNRTYLNGTVLDPEAEYVLWNGDVIRISSETFVFHQQLP